MEVGRWLRSSGHGLYTLSGLRPVCQTILRMADTLLVNEVYVSLQGESTFAGLPCIFGRLTACNLRCSYGDTAYAFKEGRKKSVAMIRSEVKRLAGKFLPDANSPPTLCIPHAAVAHRLPLVELTGGEPLLQKASLPLMKALCD